VTIRGENLDFVNNVTIGGTEATIISKNNNTLIVVCPPHTAGQNNAIILFDVDDSAPGGTAVPGGGFRYDPSAIKEKIVGITLFYLVGPGEGVDLLNNSISVSPNISCIGTPSVTVEPVTSVPGESEGIVAFKANGSFDCKACTCSLQNLPCPTNKIGSIQFTLVHTAAPGSTGLRKKVSRSANVQYDVPPPPPLTRSCSGTFNTRGCASTDR
jgi:hypothetical protein